MATENAGERKGPGRRDDSRGVARPTGQPLQEGGRRSSSNSSSSEVESLDSISRWIQSIPPAHVPVLQHMREYRDLLQAFRGLQREHGKLLAWKRRDTNLMSDNNNINNDDLTELAAMMMPVSTSSSLSSFSFLQFMASDDLVLRILDFLEAASLCKVMQTCSRFRDLVLRNAQRRTVNINRERQLPNVLQLLRAKEHIQGTAMGVGAGGPFVRVPTLLLSRCVLVTDSGDADYNGIYHCTGSNGNGFVFTKPREPFQRIRRRRRSNSNSNAQQSTGDPDTEVIADVSQVVSSQRHANNTGNDDNDSDDNKNDDYLLRCIIARRFSHETLLWYFSKEVVATAEDQGEEIRAGQVIQRYSFWARLSLLGEDVTPDLCRYPSPTSILRRNIGDPGWQPLTTTRNTAPPTVELIN